MEEQAAMKSRRKVKKIFFSIKGFISYGLLEQFFLGGGKEEGEDLHFHLPYQV
jgi:hypothetical protein